MSLRERALSVGLAIIAAVALVVTGATPVAVVIAMVFIIAALHERRSLVWVLLTGALLFLAPVAALGAVILPAPGARYDLGHQGLAALRRGLGAAVSPVLAIGASIGAFRLGRYKQALWWVIGWAPPVLIAVLGLAFFHPLPYTQTTAIIGVIGIFLSFDHAVVATPAVAEPDVAPSSDPGRTVVASGGGTLDWKQVNPAPEAVIGRPTNPPVTIADDARTLAEDFGVRNGAASAERGSP